MSRRIAAVLAVAAALSLGACGGGDGPDKPKIPSASPSASGNPEQAAIKAFDTFHQDRTSVMNTEGRPPNDALATSVTGPYREELVSQLIRSSSQWRSREGKPQITEQTATVDGDTAVVLACFNEDKWLIVTLEGKKVSPGQGPQPVGSTLTKTDEGWRVSGAAPDGKKLDCA